MTALDGGSPTRVRVVTAHEIPERSPIRLSPGDRVVAGRRDTTWPAFVFVTHEAGEGWVPASRLASVSGPTIVVQGYDTTELATIEGEELEVVDRDDEGGWVWCRNRAGSEGWVPISTLAPDRMTSW